jgi:DNA anti-recombination protein RmuC
MDNELLEKIYDELMNIRLDMVQIQYELHQIRKDIEDVQASSEEPIGIIPNTPRPDIF